MTIDVRTINTMPFEGQKPGTSGLRKPVSVFQQPHYLENFVQSIFDSIGRCEDASIALGGDGRFYNERAIQVVVRLAVANGIKRLVIGRHGILSTPAASHIIRKQQLRGGIILSASHNPGGPAGDFGIKFNDTNGGPATEAVTAAIHARTLEINRYYSVDLGRKIDLDAIGEQQIDKTTIEIIDPVTDYANLMESLFDFNRIAGLFSQKQFRMCFDAMHAVTGPYAVEIFQSRLGAPQSSVINGIPLEDFGGGHPDPNLVHAAELIDMLHGDDPLDFGAASDGDGDRNLVHGKGFYLNPCDSLAVLAFNLSVIPGYPDGAVGIARSMPTSRAPDRVARFLNIESFETPTGWKFFGNLLDAGKITICGEESFGTGSNHVREKDGLWAVLCWLNIIAVREQPLASIVREHWQRFGRDYFMRYDYEGLDQQAAQDAYQSLRDRLGGLAGKTLAGNLISRADEFCYTDPVDGSVSEQQGIRIVMQDDSRIVARLSGTGTSGATLRLYFDSYRNDPSLLAQQPKRVLEPLVTVAEELIGMRRKLQRDAPNLVT